MALAQIFYIFLLLRVIIIIILKNSKSKNPKSTLDVRGHM